MPEAPAEDRFIAAAREVKAANPNASLLMYINGLINFPEFERLKNATLADSALLLRNENGTLVTTLAPHSTFDMREPKMRCAFVEAAQYGMASGYFDGVFIDRCVRSYAQRAQSWWR